MSIRSSVSRRPAMASLGVAVAALAVVLGWASFSWACGVYADQPTAAVSPSRATPASDVTVTGTGWQPATLVVLTLSTDGAGVVQPLGGPTAASDGSFSVRVHLADQAPGVYYVSAVQGTQHMNVPVEVTGVAANVIGGQRNQLVGDAGLAALGDAERPKPQGSHFPLGGVVLAVGIVVLLAGVTTVELRRQRASS